MYTRLQSNTFVRTFVFVTPKKRIHQKVNVPGFQITY